MNWFGDVRFYGDQPVVMRGACNQHDAAYGGSTVVGMRTKKATDYRRWSRESVDEKFAADLTAQCDRFLKGRKLRKERRACYKEVPIYVGLVREFGQSVFDANSTVPGHRRRYPAGPRRRVGAATTGEHLRQNSRDSRRRTRAGGRSRPPHTGSRGPGPESGPAV